MKEFLLHRIITMGRRTKKTPNNKRKLPKSERPRTLTKKGKVKRKRGDLNLIHSRNVSFDVKQKKGGAWVRTGERKCNIHTVCDCVKRTDPSRMQYMFNR